MMPEKDFDTLFDSFAQIRVGVIGDIMLDTYWWGKVERISPEAPVPVVSVTKREHRIGGAGNVALNIKSLGAEVAVISIVGKDEEANQLTGLLLHNNINSNYIVKSPERITTNKIRIISRNQQMMRLDAEITHMLSPHEEASLIEAFEKYISNEKPDIVILEDYNKGVLTAKAIKKIIEICRQNNIITAVDPKRKNFFAYENVDIFKPNLQEAKEGLNILSEGINPKLLNNIHELLHDRLKHKLSFITLSEKGVYYQNREEHAVIPAHVHSIADVSGAGDTVIAVASLIYAATKDIRLMAEIANIAGGLVCKEVGTVAIDNNKLLKECKRLLVNNHHEVSKQT